MRGMQLVYRQPPTRLQAVRYNGNFTKAEAQNGKTCIVEEFPMLGAFGVERGNTGGTCGTEGFFKDLPAEARSDFELHARHFECPGSTVLISEAQKPSSILFLLEGEVNISMNSSDGRRLLLGVAGAGDTLGLTSAISGDTSEVRAEAMYPCRLASLRRRDFLEFLLRHPSASQNVARELSLHYARACERLRLLGLTSTAMARLAYLLLDSCRGGQETKSGFKVRCALTHCEIGECIGASRETVTRTLADFRSHDLVTLHRSTLVVTNRRALAAYAGIDPMPEPPKQAA
jgi:CRP/FNR family transcriptional regulator, cyclic AMP receptor protein